MVAKYGLRDFIEEVRDAAKRQIPAEQALEVLSPGFGRLLANPGFLKERLSTMEPSSIKDETVLYQDPDYGFVILGRGLKKKVSSPSDPVMVMPHDHGPLWALYGVYEGEVDLHRYEVDAAEASGPFPGLKRTMNKRAAAGEFDPVKPHQLHFPANVPGVGSITIVVYAKPLPCVVRRGYIPAAQRLIEFQGERPPVTLSARTVVQAP